MKKLLPSLLLLVAFSYGAVVGPSQSTMAILLDASGLCKDASSASWKNLQLDAFLKKHAFYGDSNSIYCRSYDASMSPSEVSPSEVSDSLFQGKNSIFSEAIKKWSQNGKILTSENAPIRFLVIAEGVAGLAVREYIQSKDYQGEIENVVFFNTPHEGTGFADQALLNGSSVLDKLGNLLWGHAPQPKFGTGCVVRENSADLMRRDGDIIYVRIEESGYYILETVNAVGVPQKTLFKGSWDVGEHSVTVDIGSLRPSSFIVLRKGSEILSWKLLN